MRASIALLIALLFAPQIASANVAASRKTASGVDAEIFLAHIEARASQLAEPRQETGSATAECTADITFDPSGYADSVNLYAFAKNDPINNRDPTGRFVPLLIAACAANPLCAGAIIGAGIAAGEQLFDLFAHGNVRSNAEIAGGLAAGAASGLVGAGAGGAAVKATAKLGARSTFAGAAGALAGGAAAGTTTRLATGQEVTAETLATDAAVGLLTHGALEVGGAAARRAGIRTAQRAPTSASEAGLTTPQGFTAERFGNLSAAVRRGAGHLGDDIAIHGSRAAGTARATSDIDIAIRVPADEFDTFVSSRFGSPNPGSALARTMQHALSTGKVQAGEAGLRGLRRSLAKEFGMPVDISVIRVGGPFDQGPFIPLR